MEEKSWGHYSFVWASMSILQSRVWGMREGSSDPFERYLASD